ncbi:aminomethyl-transferring glycine dehydrogenase subunit GcvPB [bacterium]|nr:aminomethyl-transferring glycine dehydrogenase subunit GcvPB [bacterium]
MTVHEEPTLIFEKGRAGRVGAQVNPIGGHSGSAAPQIGAARIPAALARSSELPLPELQELEVVRHYIGLSRKQFGIDTGFYPLGSCTMKYNPKINEAVAYNYHLAAVHPYQPEDTLPGMLRVLHDVQEWLADVSGMDVVSMHPAAGSQGEFAGMLIFKRYFESRGEHQRNVMLVPDSAHGTNPASAHLAGFEVGEIKVREHGGIMTLELLEAAIQLYGEDKIAGIMLTNPSTLGTFEENILPVARRLHEIGALLYYDGANLNALVGMARPGDMGFDLLHINTHKTFSTPHGGGGPGVGPIGVKKHLAPFLPAPLVEKTAEGSYRYVTPEQSIGRLKLGCGQFLLILRAWVYILLHGPEGLRRISEYAILNANYIQARLKDAYDIPYADRPCMHELVASASRQKSASGIRALDIAKALLNAGYHAPTTYFPLIVEEALMIEPTETESPETIEAFCRVLLEIAEKAKTAEGAEEIRRLPNLQVKHIDEAGAARNLNVRWTPEQAAKSTEAAV